MTITGPPPKFHGTRDNLPAAPCLQNPHRLSNMVAGLRIHGLLVLRGPMRSRFVGVNHGCQVSQSAGRGDLRAIGRRLGCCALMPCTDSLSLKCQELGFSVSKLSSGRWLTCAAVCLTWE